MMEQIQINCPHCGNTCEVEGEIANGQHLICPFCSEKFVYSCVESVDPIPVKAASVTEAPEDGSRSKVDTKCPHCGTGYEVDASAIGGTVQCSVCNKEFVVATTLDAVGGEVSREKNGDMNGLKLGGIESLKKLAARYWPKVKAFTLTAMKMTVSFLKVLQKKIAAFFTAKRREALLMMATNTRDKTISLWKSGMKGKFVICVISMSVIFVILMINCRGTSENPAATAKFGLGLCCYEGSAQVPQDKVEAAKLFREAAELGHVKAQFMLGTCYYNGEGVTQDKSEAARWCRKAAEQGDAEAQYYYGMMCSDGVGVPKDEKEAVNWYRRAAEQEYAEAQFNLGCCYRNGTGISQDKAEAAKWYSRAAEHGYSKAQLNLGNLYSNGEGVAKNDTEAVSWYRKAAEQGDAEAQFNLGLRYTIGDGVPVDLKEAIRCYRKSADQGYYKAQFNLGLFYFYGQGVNQDIDEAIKLFREAAKQGHQKAKDFLRKIGQDEEDACQRQGTSQTRTYEFKIGGFSDLGNSTFRESMGVDAENVSQYFDKQRKDTVYRYVTKKFDDVNTYRVAEIKTATEQSRKIVETIECWTYYTKPEGAEEVSARISKAEKVVASLVSENKIIASSPNANCYGLDEEGVTKTLGTAFIKLCLKGHGSYGIQIRTPDGTYYSWQCAVGTKDDGIFVIAALTTSDIVIRDDLYGNKE